MEYFIYFIFAISVIFGVLSLGSASKEFTEDKEAFIERHDRLSKESRVDDKYVYVEPNGAVMGIIIIIIIIIFIAAAIMKIYR